MTSCVAIVSGGMDSVTMLHYLVKRLRQQPFVLTFKYGQKHTRELACASWNARQLNLTYMTLDLSGITPLFSGSGLVNKTNESTIYTGPYYVPNRNMIFLSLAAALAEREQVNVVYSGSQEHDGQIWDTTSDFTNRINFVLAANPASSRVVVKTPFDSLPKSEILKIGLELGVDYSMTWSCYEGRDRACGKCSVCRDRLDAFFIVGQRDPLEYEPLK